jgi:integrase
MAFKYYPPGTRTKKVRGKKYTNEKWIVRFRVRGEPYEIRTDARTEKEAEAEALEFIREIRNERGPAPRSVAGVIDACKEARRPSRRDAAYLDLISGEIGGLPAEGVAQDEFDRCCARLYPGCSNETWNRQVFTPLLAALNHSSITINVKRPKIKEIEYQAYDALDEYQRDTLISEARNMDDRDLEAVLCLWFLDGLRLTESIELRRCNHPEYPYADLRDGTIKTIQRKGGVERVHLRTMHERTKAALKRCNFEADDKFIRWKTRSGPRRAIEKLIERTGIKFHPHMGRHTFGDQAHAKGASLKDMMDAGGWRSVSAAMRYTHTDFDRQRALKKLM